MAERERKPGSNGHVYEDTQRHKLISGNIGDVRSDCLNRVCTMPAAKVMGRVGAQCDLDS